MIVHRSNRIEALVDALAELVAEALPDPFASEWIAVQGRGMERWLAMELARRLDVWANPSFPFPRKVIDAAAASVLGASESSTAIFEPQTLRWAVAEALPQHLERPAFASIRRYLADDASGARRVQLAGRVADLFDQYAVYRPHLVLDWERGTDDHWQAELWRALVRTHGAAHAAARARALLAALDGGQTPGAEFPRRISLFGLSTLPPLYVQILASLARSVELHLFVLSPSREYWGDVRSRRDTIRSLARRRPRSDDAQCPPSGESDQEGHPLLASLGRVGRDFQHVLEELADYQDDGRDRYVDPGQDSMLAVLQSDILSLCTRGTGGAAAPLALRHDDDSVAVHACHSPMREVEVLHDQLLALFDRDPTLTAADVVVMTPAIDLYAPLIEAVFDSGGRPPIPCRIADRSPRTQQEVIDAFLRALEVLRGRMTAPAVLDLLTMAPVRERFGIAADGLERVRRWVSEAGIRWAADAAHRVASGQPQSDQNTWRFGLDRLLLGYALPSHETCLFGGVLPYDDIEGSGAALLGRLAEYVATLDRFRLAVQEPRHPAAWRESLAALLAALVENTPATAYQHQALGTALEELATSAAAAGFSGTVNLDAMRHLIEDAVETTGSPHGFLTGAVTFCELVPMRTIPFRVVCLLGLNDGAFPRPRRPLSFDLMAERPQAGDRTARDDDRYLFLEALLAARERAIVTYVGQNISDNSELPPSVVVNELLDAIDRAFIVPPPASAAGYAGGAAARRPRDCVLQRHALQPFSPHYFGGDPDQRAFSYASAHYAGAAALAAPDAPVKPWLSAPLPVAVPEVVPLNDLVRFFDNPSRWFLQRHLGIYLGRDLELLEEREPIELDALDEWKIGDAILQRDLRGGDRDAFWALLRAGGTLPLGAPGRFVFDKIAPRAADLAVLVRDARAGERLAPLEIELAIDGVRLTGELRDLWPGGQIVVQYSRLGGKHELGLWIRHLALHAARASTTASALFGRPAKDEGVASVWLAPVRDPLPLLTDLLRLYRCGQRAPLPFFAYASRAFAEKMASPKAPRGAWEAAREKFTPSEFRPSDGGDPYVAEIWPNGLPCDAQARGDITFTSVAQTVYAPFFRHRELRT